MKVHQNKRFLQKKYKYNHYNECNGNFKDLPKSRCKELLENAAEFVVGVKTPKLLL